MKYCKHCGKQINDTIKFCKFCGKTVTEITSSSEPLANIAQNKTPSTSQDNLKYGSFWPRTGAYMVDLLIIFVFLVVFYVIFGDWGESWDSILWLLFIIGYHTFFLSIYSATPGKMLFGLKVLYENDESDLTFTRALARTLSYLLSSLLLGIGFLKVAFDKNKHKALHDDIAKTAVMQKKYNKGLAIVLAVISSLVYFYIFGSYSEEIDEPYTIREGTREIRNQLNINEELFKEAKIENDNQNDAENTKRIETSFDVNKELAAVVSITCPDDYEKRNSWGSGTILTESGLILTNYHVIEDSNEYYCEVGVTNDLSKEPEYIYYADYVITTEEGEVTMVDEELDIAFLQIVGAVEGYQLPTKFPAVTTIGSSDALNINDQVFVAGYPSYGANTITYTDGVVSGRVGDDLIKTSAKIDFGNSGGAVFNEKGEYVGIPTLIYEGGLEGLGYIVGIDSVLDLLQVTNLDN